MTENQCASGKYTRTVSRLTQSRYLDLQCFAYFPPVALSNIHHNTFCFFFREIISNIFCALIDVRILRKYSLCECDIDLWSIVHVPRRNFAIRYAAESGPLTIDIYINKQYSYTYTVWYESDKPISVSLKSSWASLADWDENEKIRNNLQTVVKQLRKMWFFFPVKLSIFICLTYQ